jgi:hypothetical protein
MNSKNETLIIGEISPKNQNTLKTKQKAFPITKIGSQYPTTPTNLPISLFHSSGIVFESPFVSS